MHPLPRYGRARARFRIEGLGEPQPPSQTTRNKEHGVALYILVLIKSGAKRAISLGAFQQHRDFALRLHDNVHAQSVKKMQRLKGQTPRTPCRRKSPTIASTPASSQNTRRARVRP